MCYCRHDDLLPFLHVVVGCAYLYNRTWSFVFTIRHAVLVGVVCAVGQVTADWVCSSMLFCFRQLSLERCVRAM